MAIYPQILSAAVNVAAAGTRELVAAPAAGISIWVHAIHVGVAADATAKLLDSTPTDRTGTMPLYTDGNQNIDWPLTGGKEPYFKCAAGAALQVTLVGAGGDMDGLILYSLQAG